MNPANDVLFSSDLWQRALEKFGSDTHLSVKLFDADGSIVLGPVHSTPMFELFAENGYDPGIMAECARRCLEQTDSRPAVVVSEYYGLAVVGTSFVLGGKIVGAAVAGYAFVDFSQMSEVQRLARNAGINFEKLWRVAREQKPVSKARLTLNGELLQVLGDALLRENYRTRRYEEGVIRLEEAVDAKDQAYRHLRQVTSALRASEEHYRALFELGPVAVYSCDLSGVILEFNRRAVELWGRTPEPGDTDERFCGSFKLFRPDGSFMPHQQCPTADVVSGRAAEVHDAEVFIERPDGSRITVVVNVRPLKSDRGEVTGAINCFYDITERKQAEVVLRQSEERLRKTEKVAVAGQLAASMSHEINNPLSAVTNVLYILENSANLDESARALVNTAATELARVSRIVKQSLSYYHEGTVPCDLDLGGIVNESLQLFRDKFRQAKVEVKSTIASGTVLLGFADELRQVVDNLLLNAMEAMPGGGRLRISVHDSFDWVYRRRKDDRKGVRLTIADTGCGIPSEVRARIFEPFFTTKSEKGTGLGLWVLQGIIAKHEGVMSLRSSATANRSGTVISIFLPSHARGPRRKTRSRAETAA